MLIQTNTIIYAHIYEYDIRNLQVDERFIHNEISTVDERCYSEQGLLDVKRHS